MRLDPASRTDPRGMGRSDYPPLSGKAMQRGDLGNGMQAAEDWVGLGPQGACTVCRAWLLSSVLWPGSQTEALPYLIVPGPLDTCGEGLLPLLAGGASPESCHRGLPITGAFTAAEDKVQSAKGTHEIKLGPKSALSN